MLRVHICNDDNDADQVIQVLSSSPGFTGNPVKMNDPDIMVRDHSNSLGAPDLINMGKVCVVYEE